MIKKSYRVPLIPFAFLTNTFKTLEISTIERENGAVLCMKAELTAFNGRIRSFQFALFDTRKSR